MVAVWKLRGACRVSMARTNLLVQRAAATWAGVFSLPIPEFRGDRISCEDNMRAVKQFLGNCPSANEAERMAFQSIKKLLPPSCKCMEKKLLTNLQHTLTRPARILPKGYLRFVRESTDSLFRKGWDSGIYDDFCRTAAPGLSGTTDSARKKGGCLGALAGSHLDYVECVTGDRPYTVSDVEAQLMVVQSAGKPRPLTKFSSEEFLLEPLHKSIYQRLSRTRWLCRGDPTAEKLRKAGFSRGGTLVSGDYKSATDNLPLEVAEVILEAILKNTVSVPDSVKEHARKVLRPLLWNLEHEIEFEVTVGQMMGSFLSFPLLCLQNYLSFDWARLKAGLERMPLLINGDDILFQCDDEKFPQRWMDVVMGLGLEVERTKTSVSDEYGSLNSTLFEWKGDYLEVTPTLRFGMLRHAEILTSLGTSFDSFTRNLRPEIRWRAARAFFSWHLVSMKSVRACLDELGFRGGLAFRMARIFGLLPRCESVVVLPRPPVGHNVSLVTDEVTLVPDDSMTSELKVLNAREMASWKFGVEYASLLETATIRYCIAMSMIRRPEDPATWVYPTFRELTEDFSWRRLRKRFFRPREKGGGKLIPVLIRVLQSQYTEDMGPPPPYGQEMLEPETTCLRDGPHWCGHCEGCYRSGMLEKSVVGA